MTTPQPLTKKLKRVKLIRYSLTYLDQRRRLSKADCVVVSFPKAGRTWLRVLIGRVLSLKYGKELNIELEDMADENIPCIFMTHDKSNNVKPLNPNKLSYRNKKVVFLARDPRDVAVSYYHECTKRSKSPVEMDMPSFIRDPRYGVDRVITLMNIWQKNRQVPDDFLLVKYEDLRRDTPGELRKIIEFFGVKDVDDDLIQQAVEFGSFDNMRQLEKSDSFQNGRLKSRDANDQESYKVRRGKVGGYVDYLSEEDVEYMNSRIRDSLAKEYGYF